MKSNEAERKSAGGGRTEGRAAGRGAHGEEQREEERTGKSSGDEGTTLGAVDIINLNII
jgi:hypothetical protein